MKQILKTQIINQTFLLFILWVIENESSHKHNWEESNILYSLSSFLSIEYWVMDNVSKKMDIEKANHPSLDTC